MPRKQNGFGNPKSFAFNGVNKRTDVGKRKGAAGSYPSDRTFGSSVQRTVIEKYNLDSDWTKWRKGYEYYNQAAWYRLETYDPVSQIYNESKIKTKLYQGTDYEVDVVFDGYKFATKNSDSNNHYVMKRTTTSSVDLGKITEVRNNDLLYPENKKYREIWCKGTSSKDTRLLLRMIGERITDGETEATLSYLLNQKEQPALYIGKSYETPTTVKVSVPKGTIILEDEANTIENVQDLVGKIVYIKNFYQEKPTSLVDTMTWTDGDYYFTVDVEDFIPSQQIEVLDPGVEELTASLYDISTLPKIFSSPSGDLEIKGKYLYKKDIYQRFFNKQYLTAQVVEKEAESVSFTVMPYTILGVDETDTELIFTSVPFDSEFRITTVIGDGILVFPDFSFTKMSIDEYDGNYYHQVGKPGDSPWMLVDTDVNPWMDEVFTTGLPLTPATIYTCSCPNHSHSILRAPQDSQDEGTRKNNRQSKYPLPTVLGKSSYDALATNKAAGVVESWESRDHAMSFKMCKHSIAAMFIEHIKIKEPNTYPTIDARLQFEEKLAKEIEEVAEEFNLSYKRGGITALEVIFALAQGLNLDDVETAYVMLNSNF